MYAVVSTGGKQLRVEKGAEAVVEKLDAAVGDTVTLDVIFVADGDQVTTDAAALSSASVTAEVLEHFKDDKVVVFKFKKRKGYKRTKGHRQPLTRLRITEISGASGKPARKKAETEALVEHHPEDEALAVEAPEAAPKPKTAAKPKAPAKPKAEAKPKTEAKPKAPAKPKAAPKAKASTEDAAAEEKPKRTRTKKAAEPAPAESADTGE